jgi:DNA mismatch endonuclease (patch repair protein)
MDRSAIMRAVKSRNTGPEIKVRRLVHGLGYRYRLHGQNLPGKPDLVFATKRRVIFIHGCFWHGHHCPRGNRPPKTNAMYWSAKIERNRKRDTAVLEALKREGWSPFIVWECELNDLHWLAERISQFLK